MANKLRISSAYYAKDPTGIRLVYKFTNYAKPAYRQAGGGEV